jgi:hypothetical protein
LKTQIADVREAGYKPAVFIDTFLSNMSVCREEFDIIRKIAKELDVPVVNQEDCSKLHTVKKLYLFRYGQLPASTEAFILRKNGKVVPGNLNIKQTEPVE